MKTKFSISGMSCAACVKHVEDAVKKMPGVKTCSVSLLTNSLVAEYDCKQEDILSAVKKAGYGISLSTEEKKKDSRIILVRIIISTVFLLAEMYVSMGKMWNFPLPSFLENAFYNSIVQLCLCVPCLVVNYKYFTNGVLRLFRLKPDMDSLIAVGAGAAFLSGVLTLSLYKGEGYLYFEAAAMIVTLVTVGKYFEAKSRKKTGEALEKLMELAPDKATVLRNGEETIVSAEEIAVGDVVLVRQGEKIPCDGTVLQGEGYVDESAMTGESMPKEIKAGTEVKGGTTLLSGYVQITAVKTGAETTLSRMITMVEEANMNKPNLARIADKAAGVFVPVVMSIAVVTLLGWGIAGRWEQGLQCAIAVLVVSCPCALGLATPVAVTVGTGKGAKQGILFRSGESLEKLCKVSRILVDKTGTITEGKPDVTEIKEGTRTRKEILSIAAGAESFSSHPLATSIISFCKKEEIGVPPCEDFSAQFGKGVTAAIEGKTYYVGKHSFVQENSETEIEELTDVGTTVYVGTKGEYCGCILLTDNPKKDSQSAIKGLRKIGIDITMVTGDNENVAYSIAQKVGIVDVESNVLPEEKGKIVERYQRKEKVAMIGDGVNDALALSLADVGIAVGGGSDIAKGSSDVVLMNGSLAAVKNAIVISKDTVRNIRQNLFWAFVYNCIGIPVAAGVLYPAFGWTMSPMIGSVMMSLSSLFVVGNALRYKYLHGGKKMFGKKEKEGVVFKVEGMMCEHCKARVSDALKAIGVESEIDLKKKTVTCPVGCNENAVREAIMKAGYEVK